MDVLELEIIEEELIENCNFTGADLASKTFSVTRFVACDFSEADLRYAKFAECEFESCNFSLVKINETRMQDVSFIDSKIVGIDFTGLDSFLLQLSFDDCVIQSSNFSGLSLSKTNFSKSVIRDSDFVNADLSAANLSGCDLQGTLFHHTKLNSANLLNAQNYSISPLENKIKKAKFSLPEAMSLLSTFDIVLK